MKAEELRNDKLIKRWLAAKRATVETAKGYVQSMQMYTEFVKKTPTELLLEAEEEIKAGLLMRERNIETYLIDFRENQEGKNLAPKTVVTRLAAVMSFYSYYNIQLPVLPKSVRKAKPELKRKAIPTKDDIREAIKFADLRDRAMILIGVSSGLSVIDIVNLKVGDFRKGYDPETEVTTLHIVRTKTNYEFYTFLSSEASRAVWDYLEWRNRQEPGKQVTTDAGYLFIPYEIDPRYRKTGKEEYRKLDKKALIERYRDLNAASGQKAEFGEYNLIRSHNMRRFLNSTLLANGASIFFVDFVLGHEMDATRAAYYRADPKSLKEEYMKYLPSITLQKEIDPETHPDFIKLRNESETYARAAANAAVERNELIALRAELEKQKLEYEKQKLEYEKAIQNATSRQDDIAAIVQAEIAKIQKSKFELYDNPPEYIKGELQMKQRALHDQKYREEFKKGTGFDILSGDEEEEH